MHCLRLLLLRLLHLLSLRHTFFVNRALGATSCHTTSASTGVYLSSSRSAVGAGVVCKPAAEMRQSLVTCSGLRCAYKVAMAAPIDQPHSVNCKPFGLAVANAPVSCAVHIKLATLKVFRIIITCKYSNSCSSWVTKSCRVCFFPRHSL